MRRKYIIIIRIFLWLALALITGWFGYMKIAPSGRISYTYDFAKPSFFIGKPTPAERVALDFASAEIKGEPVYFSLKTPRRFEKASVTVKYKNTTDFPVVEMGLLNDKVSWSHELKPLENKIIDQLALVWPVVGGADGARLIQREKKYEAIENFLNNLPDRNEIALYDYSLKENFILEKYEPGQAGPAIDARFRGSYQFYTYLKGEELDYYFDLVDLNINKDNDPVDIKVYSSQGLVYTKHIADDAASSPERQAGFKIAGLPEGVYRLSFIANDDVVTERITSGQSRFSLINRVWLAGGDKRKSVLYTNSRSLSAQTVNPASLGIIKVGQSALDLKETYKQFSLDISDQPDSLPKIMSDRSSNRGNDQSRAAKSGESEQPAAVKIELDKGDIIISGDGVFGFNEAGLLDPRFRVVDKNIDINREEINYILTNYKAPLQSGEWRQATVEFDLTKAYQENGKYQFLISVPGLKAEEPADGEITVKEITVDLSGTGLWQKLKKLFNK